MTLGRLFSILVGLSIFLAMPSLSRAEIQTESAATYIRTLFETSTGAVAAPALCQHIAQLGKSAAGRSWRLLPPTERPLFADGFCHLAIEAVNRLHIAYPNLQMELGDVSPAPQGMMMVSSKVRKRADSAPWRVDWQVAEAAGQLRLADMRLLGLSLGIFLRSLANAEDGPPTADRILAQWRRALDRALPLRIDQMPVPSK